jgi:hypothetical protein
MVRGARPPLNYLGLTAIELDEPCIFLNFIYFAALTHTPSIPKYLSFLFFILTLVIRLIKKIKVKKKSNIYLNYIM